MDELVKIIEKSKKNNFPIKLILAQKLFKQLEFVNKEISELMDGISKATKLLKPGGKILIVSFHSIEDKIVKFLVIFQKIIKSPRYLPENKMDEELIFEKYVNKVIKVSKLELIKNNPSRSAKLRYAIRSKSEFSYPKIFIKNSANI